MLRVDNSFIYPGSSYTNSSSNTSVVTLNEVNNCNNKQQGNCPIYAQPQGTGSAEVTVTDSSGNSDVIRVKVTSSPFFVEFGQIQEPVEGNGLVTLDARVRNNGSQTRDVDVRVDPQFAPSQTKTYTGIGSGETSTRTFEFSTQSGDNGTYTATAETFEVGDVGGFVVDSNTTDFQILQDSPGLSINGFQINNTNQEVNESETIIFSIEVRNQASSTVTDTISIGNSSIGSNSTSVTIPSGQTRFVELEVPTNVGDRGQYLFSASSSTTSDSNDIQILRSAPFVDSFTNSKGNGNRNVDHTFQLSSVNNENLDDVKLEVRVNGAENYSRLLVENGNVQMMNFTGTIQAQPQQIQTNNPITVEISSKINKKGNNVKSILTVTQSDGFETVNTTSFQT